MGKKIAGLLILAVVIGATVFFSTREKENTGSTGKDTKLTTLEVLIGGEKSRLMRNPKVIEILANRYKLKINATKAGSIDMVTNMTTTGVDCLWPSNQVATELFRSRGGQILGEETIFNSPIVLYSWDEVTEALIQQKIVEKRGESYYVVDFPALVDSVMAEKTWKELGMPKLYGKVKIFSTDPTRSNSGNMFAGLLSNILNGGEVVSSDRVDELLPKVQHYFSRLGHMETSSGDLFESFLKTGMGAKPMIVGYENQLVEFSLENQEYLDMLRAKVRTLYPEPTVWSSHPIIALTTNGKKLIKALRDQEIQKIAWEEHGFRSGLLGVQNDPSLLKVIGIPASVDSVMPLPDAGVMDTLINGLKER